MKHIKLFEQFVNEASLGPKTKKFTSNFKDNSWFFLSDVEDASPAIMKAAKKSVHLIK